MQRVTKQLKKGGLKKLINKKNSHLFYCSKDTEGETLISKFKHRWGHEPTTFCFLVSKEGLYVLLNPVTLPGSLAKLKDRDD